MKVLVLGGTGWVGHHIVLDLAKNGYDVTVASRGTKAEAHYAEPVPASSRRVVVDKNNAAQMGGIIHLQQMLFCVTMVNSVSPNWVRETPSNSSCYVVSWQAR